MIKPGFLVEECTIAANGEGNVLELVQTPGRMVQLTLGVTDASEQSSLDVVVFGSADGQTWSTKPLASFPQRFYKGVAALLVNPEDLTEVKYLRAQWKVSRWGRGSLVAQFGIYVFAEELS